MRTLAASLAALMVGLCAAGRAAAENRGMLHAVGNTESTAIQPTGDVDTFVFQVPVGAALSITVKAARGTTLLPAFTLLRPDGSTVSAQEMETAKYRPGRSAVKVANFPVDVTGLWAVRVTHLSQGQAGAYTLQSKMKLPRPMKVKGLVLPEGGSVDVTFPLLTESVLSVSYKRRAGGTDQDPAKFRLIQPSGSTVPLNASLWVVTSKGFSARNLDISSPFGDYVLRLPGPATGGDAVGDLLVKVVWPKRKGQFVTRSFLEPAITLVTPTTGNAGTALQVHGSNFAVGAIVEVGTALLSNPVRAGDGTRISGAVPQGSGTVGVTVVNPDGQENSLAAAFTYLPPPTITSIVPDRGPATGGTACTITGSNFRAGMKVYFGAFPILGTVNVVNATTLTFTTEAQASGVYSVTVRDVSGAEAMLAGAFTFERVITPVAGAFAGNLSDTVRVSTGLLGDLDRDGLATDDLVVSHDIAQSDGSGGYLPATRVFRGNNNRTFTDLTSTSFPSLFFPTIPPNLGTGISGTDLGLAQTMALGDLDGDGDQDLVLGVNGSFATSSATLYFNCPVTGSAVPSVDPYNPTGYYYLRYPGTRVFRNSGNGAFTNTTMEYNAASGAFTLAMPVLAQGVIAGETFQARALALGDMDGDQDLDLVLVTTAAFPAAQMYIQYSGTTPVGCGVSNFTSSALRILANDGTGKFRFASGLGLDGGTVAESMQGIAMAVGDLDGDKDLDVVVANAVTQAFIDAGMNHTRVALNGGSGLLAKAPAALPYPSTLDDGRATTVLLHDLNGDGDLDLVLATPAFLEYDDGEGSVTRKSSTRILFNNGAAVFTDVTAAAMPAVDVIERWDASHVAVGDVDGDGDSDLVLTVDTYIYDYAYLQDFIPSTRVLLNNGQGTFARAPAAFLPPVDLDGPTYLAPDFLHGNRVFLGDLDGDGDRDIVLGSRTPPADVPVPGARSPSLRVLENK